MKNLVLSIGILLCSATTSAQPTWQKLDLPAERINDLDAHQEQLVVLSHNETRTAIHRSSDLGSTFAHDSVFPRRWADKFDAWTSFASVHTSGSHIFLGGTYNTYYGGCLFQNVGLFLRSRVDQLDWEILPISNGVSDGGSFLSFSQDVVFHHEPHSLLCGDWGSPEDVKVSHDSGKSYSVLFEDFFGLIGHKIRSKFEIAYLTHRGNPQGGRFIVTRDGGLTWDTTLFGHYLFELQSSDDYWLVKGYEPDSQWYSADGINWTHDPSFQFPPVTQRTYSFSNDSLLVSIDGGATFELHSRLPGRISKVDTTGEYIFAIVNDSSVYRYPGETKSVRQPFFSDVRIIPNPSSGRIRVSTDRPLSNIFLTTILGTKLSIDVNKHNQGGYLEFDISALTAGTYLLHVISNGQTEVQRIVKH